MADHSEQLDKLAAAMAKAQAEMPVAVADSTNPHFRFRYADLGSIWSACREVLSKHGLSVVQCPGGTASVASLTSYLLHESGQYIRTEASTAVKEGPQPYGSALTYLRRYSLAALAGIVAEEDDDGEAAQRPVRAATFSSASRLSTMNPGFSSRSSGGYPVRASSGKRATSAPAASARSSPASTRSTFPSRSPTTVLIWQAAMRTFATSQG